MLCGENRVRYRFIDELICSISDIAVNFFGTLVVSIFEIHGIPILDLYLFEWHILYGIIHTRCWCERQLREEKVNNGCSDFLVSTLLRTVTYCSLINTLRLSVEVTRILTFGCHLMNRH